MSLKHNLTMFALHRYRLITVIMILVTVVLGALIARIQVDTDPENMLAADEPVRVFHHETKERFSLSDIVVLGVVNDSDPCGVFNPGSLQRIYELTDYAKTLQWPDAENPDAGAGVVQVDIIAPSEVDHIAQAGPGAVSFEWLMPQAPETAAEAVAVRDRAMSNPMLRDTLVSGDGKALCIYLPLTSKDMSYKVYSALKEKIAALGDVPEQYHITGLPVAEDTFGVEMFIQMGVSAPLAMAVIFVLMLLFFRKLVLIISPMIVAMVSVICTMGLMIGLGYPVHIMSSMIPIFLMPIAVVDSVHILSEFFDRYTPEKGRSATIQEVMENLFTPMLYTSLTSAAGFASLALTPIPPVQVFGVFVAVGIMIAWVCTILFVPAYVMMLKEKSLANFGHASHAAASELEGTWLSRQLHRMGGWTYTAAKPILVGIVIIVMVAGYGISRIEINDNPVKWFSKGHPIRIADKQLNEHFGGTYMAYLVLEAGGAGQADQAFVEALQEDVAAHGRELAEQFDEVEPTVATLKERIGAIEPAQATQDQILADLADHAAQQAQTAPEAQFDAWYEMAAYFDLRREGLKTFKQPEVLRYMEGLQAHMEQIDAPDEQAEHGPALVGKTNSVADVVKKVYQELIDGRPENAIIPDTSAAVAQTLIQYQSSHKPQDLWHLVTQDYQAANIWVQLTSGDNKDMERVVAAVDDYFAANPPPGQLQHRWAGLTYINTVWQDRMVSGMLQSFMGSFLVVFVMMSILFRSPLWGAVCMIPLAVTIALIYGLIGLVGKDYDMPVAVLSALTLGMAVDFAIHFLQRARETYAQTGSWRESAAEMFGEPARAITRNMLVIAIGFLPLLAAPLVPYKTVGVLLCAIMALSGMITLLVLPALLTLGEKRLFRAVTQVQSPACNCGFCLIISVAVVVLVAMNAHQYFKLGWSGMVWISVIAIPVMALSCGVMSRRQACRKLPESQSS